MNPCYCYIPSTAALLVGRSGAYPGEVASAVTALMEMECHLHEALGFFSETFLRSLPELALGGAKNTTRKLSTIRRIVAKFGE